MKEFWSKLRALLSRRDIENDLRAELESHLAMEADAHRERGLPPEKALEAARRSLGNRTTIQESSRDSWAFVWIETLLQDLQYALRVLRKSPGFALTATAVIALGTGANTAAFTLLDHVLLKALPFPEPDRIVRVYQSEPSRGFLRNQTSIPNFLDWKAMNRTFESMGIHSGGSGPAIVSGLGEAQRLELSALGSTALETLRVQPEIGRLFTPEDDRDGAPSVVLLSHSLWAGMFASDPSVIGKPIRVNEQVYTIVGVLPPTFAFPTNRAQLWTCIRNTIDSLQPRANRSYNVVARLKADISVEQAQAEMKLVAEQLERAYPVDNQGVGILVETMRVSDETRTTVLAIFGAATCLLLIACANLGSLLLARAMARRKEIAVRAAIGAGRQRLVRQLLTENVVLALAGGAAGLILAALGTPLLAFLVPAGLPLDVVPRMDPRVFLFAALLTTFTALLFGAVPALRASRINDPNALRGRGGSETGSRRLRSALVLFEVAGTVTLLIGAGLLVKALWRVQSVDPGFRTENVLTMRTQLLAAKYRQIPQREEFYKRVLSETRALPGITSAAYVSFLPLVFGGGIFEVTGPGISAGPQGDILASARFATPDYFTTLRIPFRRGRDIAAQDTPTSQRVIVISESLARRLWPNQDPLGRQVNFAFADRVVVGVVGDIAMRGLERSSEPQIYMPSGQMVGLGFYTPKDLVIHSSGDPVALASAVRKIIHDADPGMAVTDVRPLEAVISEHTEGRRQQLTVIGAFTIIALLLAAVGIHGLLSFAVSTRTPEVGVRLALGAKTNQILTMFLREGLVLGISGIAISLPLAYLAATAMRSMLFGVEPSDPWTYAAAALLALIVTIAGSLRPALRAATIDPAITIRDE